VSHLNYGRESVPPEKLGHEMQYVKDAIDKQTRRSWGKKLVAAAMNTSCQAGSDWHVS
jgi:hypothetical protein